MIRVSLINAVLCLATLLTQAFRGRVVSVHDGNTIGVVTAANHYYRVRLANIDAPELGHPLGQRSKLAMSDLLFRKAVEVEDHDLDQYSRTIGMVKAPVNVNDELVREDLAWTHPRYNTDPAMPGIEQKAIAERSDSGRSRPLHLGSGGGQGLCQIAEQITWKTPDIAAQQLGT